MLSFREFPPPLNQVVYSTPPYLRPLPEGAEKKEAPPIPADYIFDNVLLGPNIPPHDAHLLYGAKTIISCLAGHGHQATKDVETMHFQCVDHPLQVLPLDAAADAIFFATEKGPVYVHCRMGVSRSTSLVVAYIMKYLQPPCRRDASLALDYVRSKRKHVNPNYGFLLQLKAYEEALNSTVRCRRERPIRDNYELFT